MSLPFLSFLLIFTSSLSSFISPTQSKIAQLRVPPKFARHTFNEASKPNKNTDHEYSTSDFKTLYFDQNLDHFTYTPQSYTTFRQRYTVVSKYWGGAKANSPIFAYLGEENSMDYDLAAIGFLRDNAPRFKALQVYIEQTSKRCYKTIRKSWDEIDRVAAKPNGISILSQKFKTCKHLNGSFALKDYLDTIYAEAVQFNWPPKSIVTAICKAVENEPPNGTDLLGRIFAGLMAFRGNESCYDVYEFFRPTGGSLSYGWQTCSEIVIPVGHERQDTMFQTTPFNMSNYITQCKRWYGVSPRPHWITTYYGGQDIKLILRRFGSNIIFSNGLLDPYSVGGVLEDISDTIVAIKTENGSHCLDLGTKDKADPEWLVMQREQELNIIDSWISKYQNDLRDLII